MVRPFLRGSGLGLTLDADGEREGPPNPMWRVILYYLVTGGLLVLALLLIAAGTLCAMVGLGGGPSKFWGFSFLFNCLGGCLMYVLRVGWVKRPPELLNQPWLEPFPVPPKEAQPQLPEVIGYHFRREMRVFALLITSVFVATYMSDQLDPPFEADPRVFLSWLGACLLIPPVFRILCEVARVMMAWILGFCPVEMLVGAGKPWIQRQIGTLEAKIGPCMSMGYVVSLPLGLQGYRWKRLCIILCGPLIELLGLAVCMVVLFQEAHQSIKWFIAVCAWGMVESLWHKFRAPVVPVDGLMLRNDSYWLRQYLKGSLKNPADELAQTWIHWALGRRYAKNNVPEFWQVMDELERILPNHELAYQYRLHFLAEEGRLEEAVAWGEEGLAHVDSLQTEWRKESQLHLSYLAALTGQTELARIVFENVLATLPDDDQRVDVMDTFACRALADHQNREAAAAHALWVIEQALALRPEEITLSGTKGCLLVELDRDAEAEPILRRVLEETTSDTDRTICATYLGIIAKHRGNDEEERHFRELATTNPAFQTVSWLHERARELTDS